MSGAAPWRVGLEITDLMVERRVLSHGTLVCYVRLSVVDQRMRHGRRDARAHFRAFSPPRTSGQGKASRPVAGLRDRHRTSQARSTKGRDRAGQHLSDLLRCGGSRPLTEPRPATRCHEATASAC